MPATLVVVELVARGNFPHPLTFGAWDVDGYEDDGKHFCLRYIIYAYFHYQQYFHECTSRILTIYTNLAL